jgi:uncharacterized protein YbjT (DUF2867 family)
MNDPTFTVGVCGPDKWLRPLLIGRLAAAGVSVRDFGVGTCSMRGIDTVVHLPVLLPKSASPTKDVGTAAARMTFAAAASSKVSRVVVLSRVGPDGRNSYLDALRMLERSALNVSRHVTIVRTTHPVGDPANPGPVVEALVRAFSGPTPAADPQVQPVHVEDLLDVMEAAIDGRIGAGFVEVGGSTSQSMSEFSASISDGDRPPLPWWGRLLAKGRAASRVTDVLSLPSVPARKLAAPLPTTRRDIAIIGSDPDTGQATA